MATTFAEHIVEKLVKASVVEEVDRELYVYGFFLLITRFFFFLVTIAFGCLFGIPFEGVIFYIVFILLRGYAGGVHAKTEMACTAWTTLAIGMTITAIKIFESLNARILPIFILENLCIWRLAPLDSVEKILNFNEKKRYRLICNGLLVACDVIVLTAVCFQIQVLYYPVVCAAMLESVLLVAGRTNNSKKKRNVPKN